MDKLIPLEVRKTIAKGKIADYAIGSMQIEKLSIEELSDILLKLSIEILNLNGKQ